MTSTHATPEITSIPEVSLAQWREPGGDRDAFAAKMNSVYPRLEARWGSEHWKRVRAEIDRVRGGK